MLRPKGQPTTSFYDTLRASQPVAAPSPPPPDAAAPPPAPPTLSISRNGCSFSKALTHAIAPRGGSPTVRIVPPKHVGGRWHLDADPRAGEGTRVPPGGFFRLPVPEKHFRRPVPQYAPGARRIVGNRNEPVQLLRFRLGEQVEPGYYELLPEL